jgi:methylglyoxal reductase
MALAGREEIVGEALTGRRDKVVIATKCGLVWHTARASISSTRMASRCIAISVRDGIVHEVEESLKRLGTDYIDLYITHWQDPTTPIAETMAALEELKKAGKIRAIGASNVSRSTTSRSILPAGSLDAIQERYSACSIARSRRTLLPLAIKNGVSTLSYSSLALGLLTGTIGPDRVFSGDDQRKDNPRFSVENRQKAKDFSDGDRPVAERTAPASRRR